MSETPEEVLATVKDAFIERAREAGIDDETIKAKLEDMFGRNCLNEARKEHS